MIRVIVAALNLKDHARVWFKIFHDIVDQLSWKQFRRALISRFGPNDYNYFGELTKLQQGRTVQEYLMEFETLLSKTNGLLTNQLVACFTSRLKEDISEEVVVLNWQG